jgi:hypothetical protein
MSRDTPPRRLRPAATATSLIFLCLERSHSDVLKLDTARRATLPRSSEARRASAWTHLRQYTDAKAEVIETILARCPHNTT